MRNAVFSTTHRELLFVFYCDKTPCEMFDILTFLTKRFCNKNEGFNKREFFIGYPKLTRPSDEFSSSVSLGLTYNFESPSSIYLQLSVQFPSILM